MENPRLVFSAVFVLFCWVASAHTGKMMLDLDAEGRPTGSFSNNIGLRDNRRGNRIDVVSSPVRSGTRSLGYFSTKGGRNELAQGPNAESFVDYWYGYSLYVKTYRENWGYMSQWHGQPDKSPFTETDCRSSCGGKDEAWRTPPCAWRVTSGGKKQFKMDVLWASKKCMCARHDGDASKHLHAMDVLFNTWLDFIVHIHLDYNTGGKGRVIVWYKTEKQTGYRKIVDYSGPVGYNDDRGTYWCIGMHKSSKGDNIYYDNIRIYREGGNSQGSEGYNAVNPDRNMTTTLIPTTPKRNPAMNAGILAEGRPRAPLMILRHDGSPANQSARSGEAPAGCYLVRIPGGRAARIIRGVFSY